jgi:hypothetical protein
VAYTMSDVIATRELTRTKQDGTTSVVEARLGTPILHINDDGEAWYCTVQVLGVENDEVLAAFGVDSMQALYLGQVLAGVLLATSRFSAEIEGNENNFFFPPAPQLEAD